MTEQELLQLKEGDLVVCISNDDECFTANKIYTIGGSYFAEALAMLEDRTLTWIKHNKRQNFVAVVSDDAGEANAWSHDRFKVLPNTSACSVLFKKGLE